MRTHPLLPAGLLLAACASPAPNQFASLTPDSATFRVENDITVPVAKGAKDVRVWFPLPRTEPEQSVADLKVEAPQGWRETNDANGNRYVYVQVQDPGEKVAVKTSFTVTRKEVNTDPKTSRPLNEAEKKEYGMWLGSDKNVVVNDEIKKLAADICGSETDPVVRARKLYRWTLDNVEYWVKDPSKWKASPVGSSEYCLANKTGNCTDFHSLWTALARASGIPTRMKYGSLFKPSLDGADRDASYHCWPESWFPGLGWVPNDVAVADIFAGPIVLDANNTEKVTLTTATGYSGPSPEWVEYYFGNLDARRVCWTMGRDLKLEPPQKGGPVNAVPKGYVEIDGAEFTGFDRKMTYREVK
jgi:hypothetical protein